MSSVSNPSDSGEARGIEVDHCPSCDGRWLDLHELDKLEATVDSTPEEREATIEYGRRDSELQCPACRTQMVACYQGIWCGIGHLPARTWLLAGR